MYAELLLLLMSILAESLPLGVELLLVLGSPVKSEAPLVGDVECSASGEFGAVVTALFLGELFCLSFSLSLELCFEIVSTNPEKRELAVDFFGLIFRFPCEGITSFINTFLNATARCFFLSVETVVKDFVEVIGL